MQLLIGHTFVRYHSFQQIMGTMKMGIPTYDATKSDVDQFPLRKTGNPAISVMIVDKIKPIHAVYGCNGPFQGSVSRLIPCFFMAAKKRR